MRTPGRNFDRVAAPPICCTFATWIRLAETAGQLGRTPPFEDDRPQQKTRRGDPARAWSHTPRLCFFTTRFGNTRQFADGAWSTCECLAPRTSRAYAVRFDARELPRTLSPPPFGSRGITHRDADVILLMNYSQTVVAGQCRNEQGDDFQSPHDLSIVVHR